MIRSFLLVVAVAGALALVSGAAAARENAPASAPPHTCTPGCAVNGGAEEGENTQGAGFLLVAVIAIAIGYGGFRIIRRRMPPAGREP